MKIPYESARKDCFFASDYPAEFDIVWNNFEKLEDMQVTLTTDLEILLCSEPNSETSVES